MMIPSPDEAAWRKNTRLFTLRRPDMGTSSVSSSTLKLHWFLPGLVRKERQLCASSSPG